MKTSNILLHKGKFKNILNKLKSAFLEGVETVKFVHISTDIYPDLDFFIRMCNKHNVKNIIVYAGRRMNLNNERLTESGMTEVRYFD